MLRRHIADSLVQALSDTPVVLVNGARQTGKTTLVQSSEAPLSGRQYLTFDDPSILAAARRDPSGFVSGLTSPHFSLGETRKSHREKLRVEKRPFFGHNCVVDRS